MRKSVNKNRKSNFDPATEALHRQIRSLVHDYQSKIPEVIKELQTCYLNLITHGSIEELSRSRAIVHKLVGSGATFGFPQISESAINLEILLDELLTSAGVVSGQCEPSAASATGASIEKSEQLRIRYENLQSTLLACHSAEHQEAKASRPHAELHAVVISTNNNLRRLIIHTLSNKQRAKSLRRYHVHCVKDFQAAADVLSRFPCKTILIEATAKNAKERIRMANNAVKQCAIQTELNFILIIDDNSTTLGFEERIEYAQMGVQTVVFQPTDPSHIATAFEELSSQAGQQPYRVLLVDDDPILAKFYQSELKQYNIELSPCLDYLNTLRMITEFKPELILLDVHLGACSGVTVAQAIRLTPEFATIPIVLLSTDKTVSRIESSKRTIADDYLTKPISAADLVRSITPRLRSARTLTELMNSLRESLAERLAALGEAKDSRAQMGVFIATLAHEIRSPLQGILGLVDLLEETNQDKTMGTYLDLIKQSGFSLSSLIANVLDYSKMSSGKLQIEAVPDSFEDLISQVFATLSGTAKQNNTRFRISLSADLITGGQNQEKAAQFIFDKARLYQVLVNLVGNSIKFSPDGLVTLCIAPIHSSSSQTGTEYGAAEVSFEVNDTGIGMTASQMSRLFDPFVQVHDGKNQAFGGTGLGLTIAKQLVEKMGGELQLASRKNVGSSFNFSILVSVAEQTAAASNTGRNTRESARFIKLTTPRSKPLRINTKTRDRTATLLAQSERIIGLQLDTLSLVSPPKGVLSNRDASETKSQSALSPQIHVLVAEDQEGNKIYIEAHLKKLGCRVTLTTNGREAIAASKIDKFDLILLDCQMPEVDGFQAASEISRHQKSVPIYALTACPGWNERLQCLASGMIDVLAKPISESALAGILSRIHPALTQKTPPLQLAAAESEDIDWQHVQEIAVIRDEAGSTLLSTMLSLWNEQVQGLEKETVEASLARNSAALKAALHRITGSAANIGASSVVSACRHLDILANQMAWGDIDLALPTLFSLVEQAHRKLADFDRKHLQWSA
jgi:signal transduction histidine kinase/HPt (histidine-containing phosphotransfer) domain-containing protein